MRELPFFKLYVAEVLIDTMQMGDAEKGKYLENLLASWAKGRTDTMPEWMSEQVSDMQDKRQKMQKNAQSRWSAKQSQPNCNAFGMQLDSNCNARAYKKEREEREEREKEPLTESFFAGPRKQGTEKERKPPKASLCLPEIPEQLQTLTNFKEAWEDWQQHRREIKKPLTSQTAKEQLAKLTQVVDPIATIRHSIAGGWQGLFEPQPKPAQVPSQQLQSKIIAPPKPVDYSFLKQYET